MNKLSLDPSAKEESTRMLEKLTDGFVMQPKPVEENPIRSMLDVAEPATNGYFKRLFEEE